MYGMYVLMSRTCAMAATSKSRIRAHGRLSDLVEKVGIGPVLDDLGMI